MPPDQVVIDLPPPDQVQWYTLKSYEGLAVTDENNPDTPIFSVKVEITRPGQTLSLYAESSIKANDKDMKVLKRPPLLYTERTQYEGVDARNRVGYTPSNIKEFIQVQDTENLEKNFMLGHGKKEAEVGEGGRVDPRTRTMSESIPEPVLRSSFELLRLGGARGLDLAAYLVCSDGGNPAGTDSADATASVIHPCMSRCAGGLGG
jgi:hypothetical protein